MAHPDDIFDPLMIRHVDADESAAEALARWRVEDRLGPMLADLRLVDLWNDLAGITAKSSDGSAESLKQLMYDSLTVAFFASRLYERVRFELRGRDERKAG